LTEWDAGLHRAEQTAHVPIAECDVNATAIVGDVAEVVVLFEEHKVELDSRAEEIQLLGISQLCCRSVDVDFVTINVGAHGAAHLQHRVWGLFDDGTEVAGLALLCRDHERRTAEEVLAATKARRAFDESVRSLCCATRVFGKLEGWSATTAADWLDGGGNEIAFYREFTWFSDLVPWEHKDFILAACAQSWATCAKDLGTATWSIVRSNYICVCGVRIVPHVLVVAAAGLAWQHVWIGVVELDRHWLAGRAAHTAAATRFFLGDEHWGWKLPFSAWHGHHLATVRKRVHVWKKRACKGIVDVKSLVHVKFTDLRQFAHGERIIAGHG